ncbi:LuxR C-terminal-related transcriptional regulator [Methylomicrobium sp. wino1]|uniref:helix-turn-helix transcriptional regulator n=1 Tax=Methylotuvimicrobium sp. TaxID=2822413 RepID=UPI000F64F30D
MAFFSDDPSIKDQKRFSQWAIVLSSIVFVLITLDIIGDYRDGVPWSHLLIEVLILMLSLAGIVYFGRLYYQYAQTKINLLTQDLALANHQAQQWREANRELIAGLAVQIQKQFDTWQLTRAEAEVGMLMLKGLSHAEIANVRNASERTVRDQARAVYRKSGLTGRTELSAFFLEDLLLPRQQ